MPLYFFHVMDGRAIVDLEGTNLSSLDEVRDQAIRTAGEILAKEKTMLSNNIPWMMTVADAGGKTVFSLKFEAVMHN